MDTTTGRQALGEGGLVGLGLAIAGVLVIASQNRRAALGTVAICLGTGLIAHGLVDSFLESMGMSYGDLY